MGNPRRLDFNEYYSIDQNNEQFNQCCFYDNQKIIRYATQIDLRDLKQRIGNQNDIIDIIPGYNKSYTFQQFYL